MTIKNLIYTIPLPEEMFDSCVGAFALANGWNEDMGVTMLEFSRVKLNEFVNVTITSYMANQAAEAARAAAMAQGSAALDTITTTLVVE
jgi:hypothetical protein